MTLLLGGSILLIAGSAVALVLGWVNAEETYIWGSIAATAAAAALLVVAYVRSRSTGTKVLEADSAETRGAAIDPDILKDREERSQQKYARQTTRGDEEGSGAETQVLAPDAPPPDGPKTDAPSTGETESTADSPTAATVGPPAGEQDAARLSEDEASDAKDEDTQKK